MNSSIKKTIKNTIKKTMVFTVMGSLALSMLSIGASAEEEFKRTDMYYDFNEYSQSMGSGIGPDENWDYAYYPNANKTDWIKSDKRKWFGSAIDDETQSGVMHIRARSSQMGEPVLLFGDTLNKGSFHISFDVKFKTTTDKFFVGIYDGNNGTTDPRITNEQNYSVALYFDASGKINFPKRDKSALGDSTDGNDLRFSSFWNTVDSGLTYQADKWHHVDLYFGDCGKVDTATARYYFDGQRVNEMDLYYSGCKGFKGLFFRSQEKSADIYLDNLYFSNFKGEEELKAFLDNDVITYAEKTVKIKLSEPATKNITANDIKITYANTGEEITDFTVTSDSNIYADIQFGGDVLPGRYEIELKSNVKGSYYKNSMTDSVVSRTEPRYESGVEVPDIKNITYKNYNGEAENKKTGISTATTAVVIDFTTAVADGTNITDNIKIASAGEDIPYTYELTNDNKTVNLVLSQLFAPDTDYSVNISQNIAALDSADAKMGVDCKEKFKTLNDPQFAIEANDIRRDGENSYFNVKVIKTNDNEGHDYTYAQAAYKEHKVTNADGVEKTYLEMTALNRFSVIVPETEKGITSLGDNQPLDITGADKVNGFLWEYPNNLPTVVK